MEGAGELGLLEQKPETEQKSRRTETENKCTVYRFSNWAFKVLSIPPGLTAHQVGRRGKDFLPIQRKNLGM